MVDIQRNLCLFALATVVAAGCDLEENTSTTGDSVSDSSRDSDSDSTTGNPTESTTAASTTEEPGPQTSGSTGGSTGGDACFEETRIGPIRSLPWIEFVGRRLLVRGDCTVGAASPLYEENQYDYFDVPLRCTLSGLMDGEQVTDMMLDYILPFHDGITPPVSEGDAVRLTLAVDFWFNQDSWVVIEDATDPQQLLFESVSGSTFDPAQQHPPLSPDIAAELGPDGWPSRFEYSYEETDCPITMGCAGFHRRVTATTDSEALTLDVDQRGTLELDGRMMEMFVEGASLHTPRTCTDTNAEQFGVTIITL